MTETTSGPPSTPPPSPPAGTDTFGRLRGLGIARPARGRWIGGVAAGLGRRWNLDPLLIRGVLVALTIVGGVGLLLYGIAWALLPEDDGRIHLQEATRGNVTAGLVGAGFFGLLFFLFSDSPGHHGPGLGLWWWGFPGILFGGLLALGVWWLVSRNQARSGRPPVPPPVTPAGPPAPGAPPAPYTAAPYGSAPYGSAPPAATPPYSAPFATPPGQAGPAASTGYGQPPVAGAPPPSYGAPGGPAVPPPLHPPRRDRASRRTTRITLGLAVLAAVAVVIVDRMTDPWADAPVIAMATALAVLATGVIVTGIRGRKAGGLAPIGILLAIVMIIGAALSDVDVRGADRASVLGDRDWRPATATQATRTYNLGFGEATLWLTEPAITSGASAAEPVQVLAQVGAGTLTVVVPEGTSVETRAELAGGELLRPDGSTRRFDGGRSDDSAEIVRTGPAGAPVMIVEARVGFGEILVRTAAPTRVSPSGLAVTPTPGPTRPTPAPTPATPSATQGVTP